jgi:elongation factor Tu
LLKEFALTGSIANARWIRSLRLLKTLRPDVIGRAVLIGTLVGLVTLLPAALALYAGLEMRPSSDQGSYLSGRLAATSMPLGIAVCLGFLVGFSWPLSKHFAADARELVEQFNGWISPIVERRIQATPLAEIGIDPEAMEDRISGALNKLLDELFADTAFRSIADTWVSKSLEILKQRVAEDLVPGLVKWLDENDRKLITAPILAQYLSESLSLVVVENLEQGIIARRRKLTWFWLGLMLLPVPILSVSTAVDQVPQRPISGPSNAGRAATESTCIELASDTLANSERRVPHLNLITIGHSQALRARLGSAILQASYRINRASYRSPGCFMDPREQHFGPTTMVFGHTEFSSIERHYGQVHFATQADFLKGVLSENIKADGAVLIVSTEDGISEQVREQLQILWLKDITAVVAVIENNGRDNVGQLGKRLGTLAAALGYEHIRILTGNLEASAEIRSGATPSVTGADLLGALDTTIPNATRREDKAFLFPIDDVFRDETGMVSQGIVQNGVVTIGDQVEIVGLTATRRAKVKAIKFMRKLLDQASARDKVGIVLADVDREDVRRGQVLAKPGTLAASREFEAVIYMLTSEDGGRSLAFKTGYRPQIYIRNADISGTIRLPANKEQLPPGDLSPSRIRLIAPAALAKGDRFVIREGNRSVGLGVVAVVNDSQD